MPITGAVLGLGGGLLGNMMSGNAQAAAQRKAQQVQADAAAKSSALNEYIQGRNQAQFQPYLDFGNQGAQSLLGGYDFRQTPEYQYRQTLGNQAMGQVQGFDPGVLDYAQGQMGQGLDLNEQDQSYNRAMDRVLIGQNQANAAGQSGQQYGSALSNAYSNSANMSALANRNIGNIQNDMLGSALGTLSGVPSYAAYQNYRGGR